MNLKSKFVRPAGAAMAAVIIITSASVAFASNQSGARHAGNSVNVPTLVLTSNGKPVSTLYAQPTKYNDVHFVWQTKGCANGIDFPPVVLQFTYNGTNVDPAGNYYQPILAPCKVNDFEAGWIQNPTGGYQFTYMTWTVDGRVVKKIAFPRSANDFELYWLKGGRVIRAWWTLNGKPVAPIQLPKGIVINDAHMILP